MGYHRDSLATFHWPTFYQTTRTYWIQMLFSPHAWNPFFYLVILSFSISRTWSTGHRHLLLVICTCSVMVVALFQLFEASVFHTGSFFLAALDRWNYPMNHRTYYQYCWIGWSFISIAEFPLRFAASPHSGHIRLCVQLRVFLANTCLYSKYQVPWLCSLSFCTNAYEILLLHFLLSVTG